jgi:hypothetical protein
MFQAGLDHLVQLKRLPSGLKIQPPLPVYNLGLREVNKSSGFNASGKLVSWRYFATGETDVSGDIDLSSNPKLTSIAYGEQVSLTLAALRLCENSAEIQGIELEPRLIRIPGLRLECLWLNPLTQSAGGDGEWAIPYNQLIRELDPKKLHPGGELLPILQKWAAEAFRKSRLPIIPGSPVD